MEQTNLKNMKTHTIVKILALAAIGLLVSCTKKDSADAGKEWKTDKLHVATTATMITDMVKIIGGDEVEVIGMVPPAVDPHTYKKSAKDIKIINTADVIFYLGLHFEGKLQEGFEQSAAKGNAVYAIGDVIPKEQLISVDGEVDPHVWGDPEVWAYTVDQVVLGLSKAAPEHAEKFKTRGESYKKELHELKTWAKVQVETLPKEQRVLITSHDAFQYFSSAFEFEVRGLQGISTADEAGLKRSNDLIEFIKKRGVKDDKGTFIGMVKHNVNTVVGALK